MNPLFQEAGPPPPAPTPGPPPPDPPVVELLAAGVTYGTQRVLRDITLAIRPGETLAVIGESGCGKTQLLKLLVGLVRPTDGDVRFHGRSLSAMSERQLTKARRRIGFLFQQAALFDSQTVRDNIAFGLRAKGGRTPAEVEDKVRLHLREVGLPDGALEKMPAELSGGMRKRVGLARALALDPEVMLYDEPTTGLDPIMSDVINELILQTRRRRPVTSVVVTHDMKTVHKVADRVVMLYPLARLGPGEPQAIYDGPAAGLSTCEDVRVRQFVEGEARDRLSELAAGPGEAET